MIATASTALPESEPAQRKEESIGSASTRAVPFWPRFAGISSSAESYLSTWCWARDTVAFTFSSSTLLAHAIPTQPLHLPDSLRNTLLSSYQVILPNRVSLPIFVDPWTSAEQNVEAIPKLSSTELDLQRPPSLIQQKLVQALAIATEITFEDGVESEFVVSLRSLVKDYGTAGVAAVESLIVSPLTNIEVAVEAARVLGMINDAV